MKLDFKVHNFAIAPNSSILTGISARSSPIFAGLCTARGISSSTRTATLCLAPWETVSLSLTSSSTLVNFLFERRETD